MSFIKRVSGFTIGNTISSVFSYLSLLCLSRYLSGSELGSFFLFQSIYLTIELILSFQLSNIVSRHLNFERDKKSFKFNIVSIEISIYFLAFILIFVIYSVIVKISYTDNPIWFIYVFLPFVFKPIGSVQGVLRFYSKEQVIACYNIVLASIRLIAILLINPSLAHALLIYATSELILNIIIFLFLFSKKYIFLDRLKMSKYKYLLVDGLKINASSIIMLPFNNADVIFLSIFFNPALISEYKMIRKLGGFVGKVINPVNSVLYTYICKYYALVMLADLRKAIHKVNYIVFCVILIIMLFIVLYIQTDFIGQILAYLLNFIINPWHLCVLVSEITLVLSSTYSMFLFGMKRDNIEIYLSLLISFLFIICGILISLISNTGIALSMVFLIPVLSVFVLRLYISNNLIKKL
nr:putative O-antigen flippase [Vibrio mimicus]